MSIGPFPVAWFSDGSGFCKQMFVLISSTTRPRLRFWSYRRQTGKVRSGTHAGYSVNHAVATDSASKSKVLEEESASSEINSGIKLELNRLSGDATMGKPAGRIYFDPLNGHFTPGNVKDLEEEMISPGEGMISTTMMRTKMGTRTTLSLKV